MEKAYVFYNPLAGNGQITEDLDALEFVLDMPCVFCDMTRPETYEIALFSMEREDILILCGGDGTLHRFANLTRELKLPNEIYYYCAGSHNDFALNLGRSCGCNPFSIKKELDALRSAGTENRDFVFLNGLCFSQPSKIRRTSRDRSGYPVPVKLSARLDGAVYSFEKTRFAALCYRPRCNGIRPDPNRRPEDTDFSVSVIHNCGRLKSQWLIHRMEKGRKVRSKYLSVFRADAVRLSFATPVSLFADGEFLGKVREIAVPAGMEREESV